MIHELKIPQHKVSTIRTLRWFRLESFSNFIFSGRYPTLKFWLSFCDFSKMRGQKILKFSGSIPGQNSNLSDFLGINSEINQYMTLLICDITTSSQHYEKKDFWCYFLWFFNINLTFDVILLNVPILKGLQSKQNRILSVGNLRESKKYRIITSVWFLHLGLVFLVLKQVLDSQVLNMSKRQRAMNSRVTLCPTGGKSTKPSMVKKSRSTSTVGSTTISN